MNTSACDNNTLNADSEEQSQSYLCIECAEDECNRTLSSDEGNVPSDFEKWHKRKT